MNTSLNERRRQYLFDVKVFDHIAEIMLQRESVSYRVHDQVA